MTQSFSFIVPGPPKGKERPRMNTKTGRVYTPQGTKQFERAIQSASSAALHNHNVWHRGGHTPTWPMDARYEVEVVGYFKNGRMCDGDNLLKAVCDGMNKIIYGDDRQVDRKVVERCKDPAYPRTEVTVTVRGGAG